MVVREIDAQHRRSISLNIYPGDAFLLQHPTKQWLPKHWNCSASKWSCGSAKMCPMRNDFPWVRHFLVARVPPDFKLPIVTLDWAQLKTTLLVRISLQRQQQRVLASCCACIGSPRIYLGRRHAVRSSRTEAFALAGCTTRPREPTLPKTASSFAPF